MTSLHSVKNPILRRVGTVGAVALLVVLNVLSLPFLVVIGVGEGAYEGYKTWRDTIAAEFPENMKAAIGLLKGDQ